MTASSYNKRAAIYFLSRIGGYVKRVIQAAIAIMLAIILLPGRAMAESPVVNQTLFPEDIKDRKIVHACGEYNGVRHANCEEALLEAIDKNRRVIEIDFMFTSDNVLVCDHAFITFGRKTVSYDEFLSSKPDEEGTAMTARRAIKLLKNTDIKLIVDTQEPKLVTVYKELKKICRKEKAEKYFENIVPQIYYEKQYRELESFNNFPEYIFEAYRLTGAPKKGGHADFKYFRKICRRRKKIRYIAFYTDYVNKNAVSIFQKIGVGVIAHPVNTISKYRQLRKMGVTAVMTDVL